jgi:hypothetical protein
MGRGRHGAAEEAGRAQLLLAACILLLRSVEGQDVDPVAYLKTQVAPERMHVPAAATHAL